MVKKKSKKSKRKDTDVPTVPDLVYGPTLPDGVDSSRKFHLLDGKI